MRYAPGFGLCLAVAAVSLSAACVEEPAEATTADEVISLNRIGLNRIGLNRIGLNRIGLNRIGLNRISAGKLKVNLSASDALLATEDGREVFSLAVSCALDADTSLVATVAGEDFEFPGEMGLAPRWVNRPLDREGQGWVSACMFARANANQVAIPISMRGDNRGLATDADEREAFPVEEGAFYGNIFGPTNQPIPWYACRGEGQFSGEFGGLIERDCTEPDPANPGFTKCGLIFAGDCGDFAHDTTCEQFNSHGTYYRKCHSAPIQKHRRGCDRDDEVFREVITTYVTP